MGISARSLLQKYWNMRGSAVEEKEYPISAKLAFGRNGVFVSAKESILWLVCCCVKA
jgi:hypothetical protein